MNRNKNRKVTFGDFVTIALAMLLLIFIVSMVSATARHIEDGLFAALGEAWNEVADGVLDFLGLGQKYKADIELPFMNQHIEIRAYHNY